MNKASFPLKLPLSLKKEAQRLANEDGVSLSHWIAVAVAQKIGSVESAAEFFRRRSAGADPEVFQRILRSMPDTPPEEWDRIPEDLKHQSTS